MYRSFLAIRGTLSDLLGAAFSPRDVVCINVACLGKFLKQQRLDFITKLRCLATPRRPVGFSGFFEDVHDIVLPAKSRSGQLFAPIFVGVKTPTPCSPARTGTPARCSKGSLGTTTGSRGTGCAYETGAAPAKSKMRSTRKVARRQEQSPPTHAGASRGMCSGAQSTQIHSTPAQEKSSSETPPSTACSV